MFQHQLVQAQTNPGKCEQHTGLLIPLFCAFHALELRERILQSAWSPVRHLRQRFRDPLNEAI